MRLNKKTQYGLLFTLYLARYERSNVETAAEILGLSKSFLEQVARTLRLAGIVRSTRGPGGGYELVGDPEMMLVLAAFDSVYLMSKFDKGVLAKKSSTGATMSTYVNLMQATVNLSMMKTVKEIVRGDYF